MEIVGLVPASLRFLPSNFVFSVFAFFRHQLH